MKNSKRFLAIIILAIVAFVSCKKDNELNLMYVLQ